MFLPNKGRGALVILYFIVSIIATGATAGFVRRQYGIVVDDYLMLSIAVMITAICTYLTKDIYIRDREGNKVKVDFYSSLFFIQMKYWPYILFVGATVLFLIFLLK